MWLDWDQNMNDDHYFFFRRLNRYFRTVISLLILEKELFFIPSCFFVILKILKNFDRVNAVEIEIKNGKQIGVQDCTDTRKCLFFLLIKYMSNPNWKSKNKELFFIYSHHWIKSRDKTWSVFLISKLFRWCSWCCRHWITCNHQSPNRDILGNLAFENFQWQRNSSESFVRSINNRWTDVHYINEFDRSFLSIEKNMTTNR